MTNQIRLGRARWPIVAGLLAVAMTGCASRAEPLTSAPIPANQVASASEATPAGPPPSAMSDQCMWIGGSTPANWICNGKPYTQQKLYRLRQDWEKKQKANR